MSDVYRQGPPMGPDGNESARERGEFSAAQQFKENTMREFEDARASVRIAAVERDVRRATRERYERAYARARQIGVRLAGILGHAVKMEPYFPPPASTEEVLIDVAPFDTGAYAEHGSRGLPPVGVPGSADDWLSRDAKIAPAQKLSRK